MFTIEPKTETIVKHSVVVTLDEEEIASILVDPRAFQKHLRQIKRLWSKRSAWSKTGQADQRPGRRAKKDAEKKSGGLETCPKCGLTFKRLASHLRACQGPDPLAE